MTADRNPWTVAEEVQWKAFFQGDRPTAPEGRTIVSARARLHAYSYTKLTNDQQHRMATAAAKFLPQIPYTGQGTHRKFIEDVQRIALRPAALAQRIYPADVFLSAVLAARKALYLYGWRDAAGNVSYFLSHEPRTEGR